MAKIKTSGTSSESAVHAEAEITLARQQAEMKAGEALFRDASQKLEAQREKILSENSDAEQNQPKDTAQISDAHMRSHKDGIRTLEEIIEWALETAGEDWKEFLAWKPEPGLSLPKQLQELSKLYLDLLEAALKYAEGENLAWQMERLDSLLAQKLNLVMKQNLEDLMVLLEQNGEMAAMDSIRSSLYRQTAGKTLSPQAAHRLFVRESQGNYGNPKVFTSSFSSPLSGSSFSGKGMNGQSLPKQESRFPQPDGCSPPYRRPSSENSSSFSGEGMIYQSSRKQNVRFQQVYHGQQNAWKEQIKQRNEIIGETRKGISETTFRQAGAFLCSGKELEAANRFAAHLNGRGNLFQNPEISARNEEVTGLLAAVMSIKSQVYPAYAGENGRANSLVLSLQKAVEKIVDYYVRQKGSANVYYYTLSAYKQTKKPQKAIQTGQEYAYQRFCEKQKDPNYQKLASYSREAGFFRALLKTMSPEKEFALGTNILQKDWENFLRAMKTAKKSSYLSGEERYSPWGVLVDPGVRHTDSNGNTAKILLGIAGIIIIAILAGIFLLSCS